MEEKRSFIGDSMRIIKQKGKKLTETDNYANFVKYGKRLVLAAFVFFLMVLLYKFSILSAVAKAELISYIRTIRLPKSKNEFQIFMKSLIYDIPKILEAAKDADINLISYEDLFAALDSSSDTSFDDILSPVRKSAPDNTVKYDKTALLKMFNDIKARIMALYDGSENPRT
jgi:hypothetical protein